ncbi:Membrane protein involved in the export of O-antigen and teichoic acid [Psychroflexus salarius]|uniref:Membrane protein involved in the export of O-antigen and teichoic acid n=1 Tax=Psychroflexus salarius TaxID=1155689 RepID=A0A1M4UUA2_9FLAO|nr:flippase [Psychroflexus salarius]SHE60265.1 Membrane protein involved in the export of O-antigen and teichoic acid [Psychroflexus salarius]
MNKRLSDILKDADFKEILTKGFSFLLFRLGGTLAGYFFTLFISNKFGEDIYGLVAIGFSMFLILSVVGRLGLDTNMIKFFSQDTNDQESGIFYKSILKSFVLSSLLAGVIYLFKETIVLDFFKEPKPELIPFLPWVLAAIPLWSVTIISASFLRAKKKNNAFALFNNPSRFLFGLVLLIIFYSFSQEAMVIFKAHFYAVAISAVLSFGLVVYYLKTLQLKTQTNSWFFLKDSLPMMLSSSILILLGWMDTLVMGIFETDANVGIYNVSLKVASLSVFSLQAINSILAPKIAKSYAEGQTDYKRLIAFSTKLNFMISGVIVVGIIVFHKFLLGMFGEAFTAGATILFIFCAGQIINSFSGSVGVILQMIGKQKVYQNFVLAALVINLMLTFVLTPIYGGVGAAVSTVISMVFWNIGSAIYLKRKMNIVTYYRLN